MPDNAPIALLREVLLTVESIGMDQTVMILQGGRGENKMHPHVLFVIDAVGRELETTTEKILNDRYSKTDIRIYSIAFCVYFLMNHFDFSARQCGEIFDLNRATVSKRKSIIENLSPTTKGAGAKYLQAKYRLIKTVRKYAKSKDKIH